MKREKGYAKEKCPSCGSENYRPASGCWICLDCGYSPCK